MGGGEGRVRKSAIRTAITTITTTIVRNKNKTKMLLVSKL